MFALTLIDDSHRYVFKTGWSQRNISEIRSSRFFFRASGNREMTKKKEPPSTCFLLAFPFFQHVTDKSQQIKPKSFHERSSEFTSF